MIFSKLIPDYEIKEDIGGFEGKKQIIAQRGIGKKFNPFRIQHGGTKIRNTWFSDKTIVGKILKFIFE